ncbi:filamentous hemagglutinin family protein [Microbacteriaceae bacterium K1510]|nr:filamentous hemagglutinin family protein [Microbacteriaceae bacterium K1510]
MPSSSRKFPTRRAKLFATVSALALIAAVPGAMARPLGGQPSSPSAAAIAAAQAAQVEASQAARDAQNALKRATLAVQAMQASQQAARDAARAQLNATPNIVPNGLQPGGLQVAPGVATGANLWQGADLPTENASGGKANVTVKQSQQKAILEWKTFNVGGNTQLYFDQSAGGANKADWIAFNRVLDPSGAPSRILGSIRAEGQVYIINQNGIVFGGASQVNVGALVASSLALTNEQFQAGINKQLFGTDASGNTYVYKPQFGYLGQRQPNQFVSVNDPSQVPGAVIGAAPGNVNVEAGARIETASGGKVMLFAPKVINSGQISAPDGQVIMAAGEQVYLLTSQTGVRGLDVAVSSPMRWLFDYYAMQAATNPLAPANAFAQDLRNIVFPEMAARAASVGYRVVNDGVVQSDRGNITIIGREIVQNGGLFASTKLNNRDGSIRLLAWDQGMMANGSSFSGSPLQYWSTGSLTLGANSVVMVTPDLSDVEEIEQTSLATRYQPGRVELRGNLIDVQAGASVIVPAGKISIVASTSPLSGEEPISGEPTVRDGSRVYIGENAYLSVAGLQDIAVSMDRNFIEAQLYINELRDTPLYRDSWLRGLKVIVDRRRSGVFTSGPMAVVNWIDGQPGRWVGTPLADVSSWVGVGKTDLAELSTKAGSIVIKSSGSIITREGSLLDVSGGSVRYTDGWNTTTKLRGADGRIYNIGDALPDQIYTAVGGGFTRGNAHWGVSQTWTGPLSKSARTFEKGYIEGRDAGSIQFFAAEALVLEGSYWGGVVVGQRQAALGNLAKAGSLKIGANSDPARLWLPGNLIIASDPARLPDDFNASSTLDTIWYDPNSTNPHRDKVTYLDPAVLAQSGMGSFEFYVAKGFTLGAGETLELLPGAKLNVISNVPTSLPTTFTIDGTIRIAGGDIWLVGQNNTFGANSRIDVSGQWINELLNPGASLLQQIDGGTVQVAGSFEQGAVIDVSGGAKLSGGGKPRITAGDAGRIRLEIADANMLSNIDLRGYAAGSGGELELITSSNVELGGAATNAAAFHLNDSLLGDRGFRSLSVTTQGTITVAEGASIEHRVSNLVIDTQKAFAAQTGTSMQGLGTLAVLPVYERVDRKPNALSLVGGTNVTVGAGAVIRTDIGGSIVLATSEPGGQVVVKGTLDAPAGTIQLSAGNGDVTLVDGGSLLARGLATLVKNGNLPPVVDVRAGGSVGISGATVTLEAGSLVDVSGASGVLTVPMGGGLQRGSTDYRIDSNGGSISISLQSGLIAGRLVANAGGPGAINGKISINAEVSGGFNPIEAIKNDGGLGILDPDCWGYVANGACDYNPLDVIGFDLARIVRDLGIPASGPWLISKEMIESGTGGNIIITSAPAAGGSSVDPRNYGWTDATIQELRDTVGTDLLSIFPPTVQVRNVYVRPDVLASGSFADVSLTTAASIKLDNAVIKADRSLSISAPLVNFNGGSSTLIAPYMSLTGAGSSSTTREGRLTLVASVIDVNSEMDIRGFAETVFDTSDLRFRAPFDAAIPPLAMLDVDGALVLRAGQVYPASGVKATIKASDRITVERKDVVAPPLSAGGSLTLAAPIIEQNGVLRAPFGQITLKASERLVLGAGSVTSVSGVGLVVPYGSLSNGENWLDPTKPGAVGADGALTAPPEKRISLEAPIVESQAGSVIDIRGGGDLYAREFVPGPGGSHDILASANSYAVIPGFTGVSPGGAVGERVWLAGGNGLAAGWYTLLPASYAALPGAYLVSLVSPSTTTPLAKPVNLADGSVMMTGRRGDVLLGSEDQLSSVWRVMTGTQLRRYTEYNEAFANTFFASEAFKLTQYRLTGINVVTPRLPLDGGAVVFKAMQQLVLDGSLQAQTPEGGRGSLIDIAGTKIAIVGAGVDASSLRADGYLVIDSASLSKFGAGSLLIGGTRTGDPLGLRLDVTASDILVRNDSGSALTGPEVILAASGLVDIGAGSVIKAEGTATSGAGNLIMKPQVAARYADPDGWDDGNPADDVLVSPSKDYGALIRVSNGDVVQVIRENVDTTIGGTVRVGEGVRLTADRALLIDATQTTDLAGSAVLSATSLSVASGRIGFGGGTSGLVLSLESLKQLNRAESLTLRSYTTLDFYASFNLSGAGLASVTFDGAGLVGYGTNDIAVSGGQIALINSGGGTATAGSGSGTLTLAADELILGAGTKTISGFDHVVLWGRRQITGQGNGGIDAGAAALTVDTPLLTGRSGAAQTLMTGGALRLTGAGTTSASLEDSLGTRLTLKGQTVEVATRIAALGGAVELTAGAGGVALANGAVIDVGGFAKQFFDVSAYADAGRITLTAVDGGNVVVGGGAILNLAAHAGGGNAGRLAATASGGGTVVLDGAISAQAGASGKGGTFALDIAELPNFAAFADRLNAAGFTRSRQFRIRSGDVVVSRMTQVEDFQLAADQGRVTIAGTIDARATYGGNISISGGNGLVMEGAAYLLAGATDVALGSGRVTLEAAGGRLDVRGGTIDVAGGERGQVRFRALQNAGHDGIAVDALAAHIIGARSAVLEGVSVYNSTTTSAVQVQAVNDAGTFSTYAGTIANALGFDLRDIAIMSGIEIRSIGDLVVDQDWNLFADFGASQREGTLTLRAAGNLIVNGNLSDGFDRADRSGVLQDAASWNLRLVAGADLGSASALTTVPLAGLGSNSGTITVGNSSAGKLVRTGTGDIELRAGRNVDLAHYQSAIYTAGRKDTTIWNNFAAPSAATYGIEGGHLTIAAGGNISSTLPANPKDNQLFVEWLKHIGGTDQDYVFRSGEQSSWWIDYAQFAQGVGALGGGNVSVSAGGDLDNILVALPTNGRVRGGRTSGEAKSLEMRNGGALTVDVEGALRAGYYYVGRGTGTITAGETTTGRTVTIGGIGAQTYDIAPVFALGDAALSVRTAGNLIVQTVLDPLMLTGDPVLLGGTSRQSAIMSGYTNRTALNLVSIGGNVSLINQGQFLSKDLTIGNVYNGDLDYSMIGVFATNLYPSITNVTALNGSITNFGKLFLAPGTHPDLQLLADQDIVLGQLTQARGTPDMMPSAFRPVDGVNGLVIVLVGYSNAEFQDARRSGFHSVLQNDIAVSDSVNFGYHSLYLHSIANPDVLPNAGDYEPSRIYARRGTISNVLRRDAIDQFATRVMTAEQTWFRAGTDIRDINYQLRNIHSTDASLLEAGNDIIGGTVQVQGPGLVMLSTGRDVYGQALSITTTGNRSFDNNNRPIVGTDIRGLPEQGASISVMAGLQGKRPSYDAFIAAYLDPAHVAAMPAYLTTTLPDGTLVPLYLTEQSEERGGQQKLVRFGLVSFIEEVTGETLSPLGAWARFQSLPELVRHTFVNRVYMQELRQAGRDQLTPDSRGRPLNGGYNRGYAAIAALFPGEGWRGDVLGQSLTLRTMAGGGIDVLAPGGGLQIAALGAAIGDGQGLVALGPGDINVFVKKSVTVNRSRILTFGGGDEALWATLGDIDAGRGAKTARVPSAPEVATSLDAVTRVRERADISGSGIGTIIGFAGVVQGDVDLVAPEGTVNAGDAGIRVAGNLNLAALRVLNAGNIEVGGQSKGVPVIEAPNIGGLTEAGNTAGAAAQQAATPQQRANEQPSIIIVEVLGFGGGDGDQERARKLEQRSQNPDSAVQIVGAGNLDLGALQQLTAEERKRVVPASIDNKRAN